MATGSSGTNTYNPDDPNASGAQNAPKPAAQPAMGQPYPSGGNEYAGGGGSYQEPRNIIGNDSPQNTSGNFGMQPQQYDPMAGLTGQYASPAHSSFSYSSAPAAYQQNPYLAEQAANIRTQGNQNLNENTLPALRDQFVGAGGLGGSRQGIAEGLAAGRANQGMNSAITDMYSNDYNNSQNRQVQVNAANNSAGLQYQNMQMNDAMNRLNSERNFYSTNRGQDLQQMGLGAGLLGQANQGFLNQGAGIYNLGTQEQNAPWQQLSNYAGLMQPYTQAGATNSGTQTQQYSYNPAMQWIGAGAGLAGAAGGLGWKPFG